MSGSDSPLDFLKKLSSKMDKLFLGDMIKSNNSNSSDFSKKQDIYSENLYDEEYNSRIYSNSNIKNNSSINNDLNMNNNSNFSEEYSKIIKDESYLDDRYSKYISANESYDLDYRDSYPNNYDRNNIHYKNRYEDMNYYSTDFREMDNYNRNSHNSYNSPNYDHNFNNPNSDYYVHNYDFNHDSGYDSTSWDNEIQYDSNEDYESDKPKFIEFLNLFNLNNLKSMLLDSGDASKNRLGVFACVLIILVLGGSIFYFGFYQPFMNELNTEKTAKLNELNTLYKGPLEVNDHFYYMRNMIEDSQSIEDVKSIDVLRTATKDWRDYHVIKINSFEDSYGRIMMSYSENDSKKVLMPSKDAKLFVNEHDAKILSNIVFEKVDTVIIPVSITRLQATGGLLSVGSIVDIYSLSSENSISSNSEESASNSNSSNNANGANVENGVNGGSTSSKSYVSEEPDVSGATVLAILRSKESGVVDSTFTSSTNLVKGNTTYPTEHSSSFSTDVEELLKSSVFDGNTNNALDSYLNSYGIKLSNYERLSNIGELDTEYLVLLEVPRSDVNFVINNMENLILTIPTEYAPNWAVNELNETYYKQLNNNKNYF